MFGGVILGRLVGWWYGAAERVTAGGLFHFRHNIYIYEHEDNRGLGTQSPLAVFLLLIYMQ